MMNVYCRINGKLAMFHVDTDRHEEARLSVNLHRSECTGSVRIGGTKWSHGPVLAVLPGISAPQPEAA